MYEKFSSKIRLNLVRCELPITFSLSYTKEFYTKLTGSSPLEKWDSLNCGHKLNFFFHERCWKSFAGSSPSRKVRTAFFFFRSLDELDRRIVRWPFKDFNRAINVWYGVPRKSPMIHIRWSILSLCSSLLFRGERACKKWPCTILTGSLIRVQDSAHFVHHLARPTR